MGERGNRSSLVTYLAEAASAQEHFDQALRLTEEAEALTRPVGRSYPARDTTCHHVQCVPKSRLRPVFALVRVVPAGVCKIADDSLPRFESWTCH